MRPRYLALILIGALAAGAGWRRTKTPGADVVPDPVGPAREAVKECRDPTVLAGYSANVERTIRVRARTQMVSAGCGGTEHAVVDRPRVERDIESLNAIFFEAAGLRFELIEGPLGFEDREIRRASDACDILLPPFKEGCETVSSCPGRCAACSPEVAKLGADAMLLTYASDLDRGYAAAEGAANTCGVVINADSTKDGATPRYLLAHEVGHYFGLDHTHDCTESVSDTPPDPGPEDEDEYCATTRQLEEGTCEQGAACGACGSCSEDQRCAVTCSDGEKPDGRNFMSYYEASCLNSFTPEQLARVRCMADKVKGPTAVTDCRRQAGEYVWSCHGPIDGMDCTRLLEAKDPNGWDDNYLCSRTPGGHTIWSSSGPNPDYRCTQITEPAEDANHGWDDNYLCVRRPPPGGVGSAVDLHWSYAGPIDGRTCLQLLEPEDQEHTWSDNYLCW